MVGPLWAVESLLALVFADAFYEAFLDQGLKLGEATHFARLAVRRESPKDSGWLAYACLGHPLASAQGHYTSLFLSFSYAQIPVADEVAQV